MSSRDDMSGLGAQQYDNSDSTGSALNPSDGRGDGGYGGTSTGGDTLGGDQAGDSRGGDVPSVTYSGGEGGAGDSREQTGAQAKLGDKIDKYDSGNTGNTGQGRQEYGMGSGRTEAQEEGGIGGEIGSTDKKSSSSGGGLLDKAKHLVGK